MVGIGLAVIQGRREGVAAQHVVNLGLGLLLSSVAGARIAFVLTADIPESATGDSSLLDRLLNPGAGGFTVYGGIIAGLIVLALFARIQKLPTLVLADIVVPSVALGQGLGRMGCVLAGCCWGRPSDAPLPAGLLRIVDLDWPRALSMRFVHTDTLCGMPGVPLVPTQLLMSITCLGIFALLWGVLRHRPRQTGDLFAWYLVLYSSTRTFWELFRADPRGLYLGETLSTSQLISIPALALGLWLLLRRRAETKESGAS
jgi:phosphatidylglycerol:prolipoprotein diacylglycerol transferase